MQQKQKKVSTLEIALDSSAASWRTPVRRVPHGIHRNLSLSLRESVWTDCGRAALPHGIHRNLSLSLRESVWTDCGRAALRVVPLPPPRWMGEVRASVEQGWGALGPKNLCTKNGPTRFSPS